MKKKNERTFKIDFIEFAFLVEACIPPRPIARSYFWYKVIDEYYDILTDNERERLFKWIIEHPSFDKSNVDCELFYDRFCPSNQYLVRTEYNGESEYHKCFMHNNRFHKDSKTSIIEDYISHFSPIF